MNNIDSQDQVKSKQRVADHGEVFTAKREVNAMLDLVKNETERLDSRFLEPACGTGNFLHEILERKLKVVENTYKKSQNEYEKYSILALSSVYGIDILLDNVEACRERLLALLTHYYTKNASEDCKKEYFKSAEYILSKNIIWGDALKLTTVDNNADPITFSEWAFVDGSMLKRRDFKLKSMIASAPIKKTEQEGLNFQPEDDRLDNEQDNRPFIPTPIKEFPLTHFLQIADLDE